MKHYYFFASVKKHLLQSKFLFIIACLFIASGLRAQVINEGFEEPDWTSITSSTTIASGSVVITATSASNILTYVSATSAFSTTITSSGTGSSSTATSTVASALTSTSINTAPNSGTWWYSKGRITTDPNGIKVHSISNGWTIGSGGYLITPIVPAGVVTVTCWIAPASSFFIAANTDVTNVPITNYKSSKSSNGFTYGPVTFSGTSTASNLQSYSYSTYLSNAGQIGFFNTAGKSILIDDITISSTTPTCTTPTLSGVLSVAACNGSNAPVYLQGLVANSLSDSIFYSIAGGNTQFAIVNATANGTGSFTVPVTTANNGQTLTVSRIASGTCSSNFNTNNSTSLIVSVSPTISISIADTSLCKGATAIFTANALNAGNQPIYIWKVNGTKSGGDSATFISTTLKNKSIVTCQVVDTSSCSLPDTVISNSLNISVLSPVTNNKSVVGCNSVLYNGNTYTSSTVISDTLRSLKGCDSVYNVISITVGQSNPVTDTIKLTGCTSVTYKNVVYTSNTKFTDTVRSFTTCDSLYHIVNITLGSCGTIINSFAPAIAGAGNTVVIKGTGFTGATNVSFGGVAAKSFTVNNDSTINSIVGNGATGTVSVTTPKGTSSVAGFTYDSTLNGLIVTGLQSASPFISSVPNVAVSISNGAGILQVPKDTTTGIIFGSKAVGVPGFAGDGTGASFTTSENKGEWVQFAVAPVAGNNLNITGFNIKGKSSSASASNFYVVAYAIADTSLFGKGTCTYLDSAGVIGNNPTTAVGDISSAAFSAGQNIAVKSGDSIFIRVYIWRKNASSSSSQFTITDFRIAGTVASAGGVGIPDSSVLNKNICYGSSYTFNGTSYNKTGAYTFHFTNASGADSAAILHLSVSAAPVVNAISNSGCNYVLYKGVTYTSSIIVRDTVRNINGCDSIYNVDTITVNPGIYGNIINPGGKQIPNVIVTITDSTSQSSQSVTTSGNYSFTCLASGSNKKIKLSKNNDKTKLNGVSALDIAYIQNHILGKSILNSPYKILAADVNGDGKVSALDIAYIKRLILKYDTTFTKAVTGEKRLWLFVDSSYSLSNLKAPFVYKDSFNYINLTSTKVNQTFIGMKLGDVTWDWNPATLRPGVENTSNALELSYSSDAVVSADGLIHVPVKVKNFKEMLGLQFTLGFDATNLNFKGIADNVLNIESGTTEADQGNVSFLWVDPNNEIKTLNDGSIMMELLFEKTGIASLTTNSFGLNNNVTTIAAYDKNFGLHNIVLTKDQSPVIKEVFTVAPNPTTDGVIHVQMNLKNSKSVMFKLIDNKGRMVITKQVQGMQGNNNFTLKQESKLPTGIYYLQAVGVDGEGVKTIIIN